LSSFYSNHPTSWSQKWGGSSTDENQQDEIWSGMCFFAIILR